MAMPVAMPIRKSQACSSSTSVPQKSLGCRNSTGLSWAPILGVPSPSTRAPAALRRLRLPSGLLEFDQGAAEVFGGEEQHRLVVGADLGRAVAEHAGAGGLEAVAGGEDVVDLV